MGVTQKPSNRHFSGRAHHLPWPQERYVCLLICTERAHWFLTLMELYIMNLFHKNRLSKVLLHGHFTVAEGRMGKQ